jgi:hypothetical protein
MYRSFFDQDGGVHVARGNVSFSIRSVVEELNRLTAENKRLSADRDRLSWIESECAYVEPGGVTGPPFWPMTVPGGTFSGANLRDAVDGARPTPPTLPAVIFMDIDGCLNRHGYDPVAESCTIDPECVRNFNRVLDAVPDAMIVLSSAWRYMVLNGAMTLKGFEYLLRTHGVHCAGRLLDITCPDEEIETRGQQIRHWLNEHGGDRHYVVIDDGGVMENRWYDLGINAAGLPVVWCEGTIGLTEVGAEVATVKLRMDWRLQ